MEAERNSLEPQSLVHAFLQHPPEDFVIQKIPSGNTEVIGFFADLDLFTTFEDRAKKIVDTLRKFLLIDFLIKNCLTPNVFFVGTSISEYCIWPQSLDFSDFKQQLNDIFVRAKRQFLIVKDIPCDSPLLSPEDNQNAAQLTAYLKENNFIILSGQALAYLPIDFTTMEEYLQKFTSNRRNNFRRKMKVGATITVSRIPCGDSFFTDAMLECFYTLYLGTYEHSDIHFDKLSPEFFRQVLQVSKDGFVVVYKHAEKIIGFNVCYIVGDVLVDKFRGSLYPESYDVALFFNLFFENIRYCLEHGLKTYIIGWTAPRAKAYLGCQFTYTYHAVYIKNPVIRSVLSFFQSYFEGDKAALAAVKATHE